MQAQTEILVIGTNDVILKTIVRLVNNNILWNATGVSSVSEALSRCKKNHYQVLLIGAGLSEEEEASVRREVSENYPDIRIMLHYGGGSGLLSAEIYLALAQKKAD